MPLSKAVSASGADAIRRPAAAETRPHSTDTRDTLKRDKLAEEVERIAVSLYTLYACTCREREREGMRERVRGSETER